MKKPLLFFICLLFMSCTYPTKCHRIFYTILKLWSQRVERIDLYAGGTGGGIKNDKIERLCISLEAQCIFDIDSARERAVSTYCILLKIMQDNPEYLQYFPEGNVQLNKLSISIFGEKPLKTEPNFVSNVIFSSGNLMYYRRIDTPMLSDLDPFYIESFETAVKILKEQGACLPILAFKVNPEFSTLTCGSHPDAPIFDHSFLNPTYLPYIRNIIMPFIKNNIGFERVKAAGIRRSQAPPYC